MKKILFTSLLFILFIVPLKGVFAFGTCDPSSLSLPCTKSAVDYYHYIGNATKVVFYNVPDSIITHDSFAVGYDEFSSVGGDGTAFVACTSVRVSCTDFGLVTGTFIDYTDGSFVWSDTIITSSQIVSFSPGNGNTYTQGPPSFDAEVYNFASDTPYAKGVEWDVFRYASGVQDETHYEPVRYKFLGPVYAEHYVLTNVDTFSPVYYGPGHYNMTVSLYNDIDNAHYVATSSDFYISVFDYATTTSAIIQNAVSAQGRAIVLECAFWAPGSFDSGAGFPWSSNGFNMIECLKDLLLPVSDSLVPILQSIKDSFVTRFPFGYVTDFVTTVTSTATSSLPVISATIPSGIAGAGSHIDLNLAHSLDFVLNATTSQFANVSASSTETFYDITNRYWSYICYMLFGLYLVGRIISMRTPKI
jgi:hypothetical protein